MSGDGKPTEVRSESTKKGRVAVSSRAFRIIKEQDADKERLDQLSDSKPAISNG